METITHILILCSALLGSSVVIYAHRHAPHVYTPHHRHAPHAPHHRHAPHAPHQHAPHVYSHDNIHDVTQFGAVGDERTDDTNAFKSAWEAACEKESNLGAVRIPGGKTYLVSPIVFQGPCKSPTMKVEILGKVVAPPRKAWKTKKAEEWLTFHQVDGLIVEGNGEGLIDGKGDSWWKFGNENTRPTALRFSHCNKLQVRGLKHRNSQKNHVSINECNDATISQLHISAPEKSPNTDGIDISSSTNLHIHDCTMATGDDCIAINGGTSHVSISNIACGPGHGISIGSLGREGRNDQVEAINVSNCTFSRTKNGVRIKTWQGGSGFARNITFSSITFVEASNPVLIDQYYCPHKKCGNKTSAVKVSNVRYMGLHGTSNCKNAMIDFRCSKTVPCTNIVLEDINIRSANRNSSPLASCINAHGKVHGCSPALNCLQNI